MIVHELCLDRSGPSASAYKLEFSAHDCSWSGLSVGKMLYVQLRVFGPFLDIPDVLAEVRRWMLVLSPAPAPARGGGERRQQRRQPEELEFFVMYSRPVPAAFCGALVRAHECKTRDACFECGPCRASMEALVGQSKRHFRAAKAMEGIDEHLYTLKLIDSLGEGPLTIDAFEETPSSVEG